MKINTEQLRMALQRTAPAVNNSPSLPALNYLCIRNRVAMVTNLRMTILSKVDTDYEGLLPHKLLSNIIPNIKSAEVDISKQDGALILRDGKAIHKIGAYQPIENYPKEPEFNAENAIKLTQEQVFSLNDAIKFEGVKTSAIEGVYIGEDIAATTGTVVYKQQFEGCCQLHIPSEFIKLLPQEECELNYNNRFASIATDDAVYITTLLETRFPNYQIAYEQFPIEYNISLNKEAFLNELKCILAYGSTLTKTSFKFTRNNCSIIFVDSDFNNEYRNDIPCETEVEMTASLDARQLFDAVQTIQNHEFKMALADPEKSVYLKGDEKTTILIQPLKIL